MIVWQFVKQGILIAYRSRMIPLVLALTLSVLMAMRIAYGFSPRQPLVVGLDVGLSALRIAALFLLVVLAQLLIATDIDRKNIYGVLVLPLGRSAYLLGRFGAIVIVLGLLFGLAGISLWALGKFLAGNFTGLSEPEWPSLPLVLGGLFVEQCVILSVMMLFATLAKTPFLASGLTLLFALAGRGLHAALTYLLHDAEASQQIKTALLPTLIQVRWVVPDLSRLDWRNVALYHVPLEQGMLYRELLATALPYSVVVLLLAIFLLSRRQFD